MVPAGRSAKDLDEVMAMAARKKYRAVVDKTFPMAKVAEATRHLEGRKAVGKGVLTIEAGGSSDWGAGPNDEHHEARGRRRPEAYARVR